MIPWSHSSSLWIFDQWSGWARFCRISSPKSGFRCIRCTRCQENPWWFFWCSDSSGWCFLDKGSALALKFKVVSVDSSSIHVLKTSFDDNASCISTRCLLTVLLTVLVSVCWATFVSEYSPEYHPPYWKTESPVRKVPNVWWLFPACFTLLNPFCSYTLHICWIQEIYKNPNYIDHMFETPQVSKFIYGNPWIEMSPTHFIQVPPEWFWGLKTTSSDHTRKGRSLLRVGGFLLDKWDVLERSVIGKNAN